VNIASFFSELKRRNVYKVAVACAVVSWLVIQAASLLLATFEAPPWAMKVFVIAVVLGFPVALVLAWAFELTPEGIKLESEVPPEQSIRRKTGRKIVAITVALAVIAAGLFLFQIIRARSKSPAAQVSQELSNKSIAVLPFENLSRDPNNAYFCEGVQDEILTRLAKVADLKVIARIDATFQERTGRFARGRPATRGDERSRRQCPESESHVRVGANVDDFRYSSASHAKPQV
jgi:hypothetical protein